MKPRLNSLAWMPSVRSGWTRHNSSPGLYHPYGEAWWWQHHAVEMVFIGLSLTQPATLLHSFFSISWVVWPISVFLPPWFWICSLCMTIVLDTDYKPACSFYNKFTFFAVIPWLQLDPFPHSPPRFRDRTTLNTQPKKCRNGFGTICDCPWGAQPEPGHEPEQKSLEKHENSCATNAPHPTWQSLRGSAKNGRTSPNTGVPNL